MDNAETLGHEIAIIGMIGRFPGAKHVDELWEHLCDGIESITFFSDEELLASGVDAAVLNDPQYVKAGGLLEEIDLFDASFFGYSPREAELLDPQQRIFLECAWEALETAGYNPERYPGRIGVYAGTPISTYFLANLYPNEYLRGSTSYHQMLLGNDKDHLAPRVSYKLNLKGPSVNINTACSTSLVAIHLACQSLLNGECDLVLAGGISIAVPQKAGYFYRTGMIGSPDGHCRAFDADAQGTLRGDGVGIVVLKRLEDALAEGDGIHAVIKGSAINNDGALKVGYTAPSVDGQAEVIAEAIAMAGVHPETISYVEAHGTGTPLGDPIEVAALTQAFRAHTQAKGFCALGSVKTNIGHLDAAAGVAGLIKTTLALKHKLLPPSLHFKQPNPKIDFANSPFYVNTRTTPWEPGKTPRRAGVSSFGIGGTNAHVILEEAPSMNPSGPSRPWHLLILSAKTRPALDRATQNLHTWLTDHPDLNLADVAYTLMVGRREFNQRRFLVCHDLEDTVQALEKLPPERVLTLEQQHTEQPVIFMFPGQGSQYANMALELYRGEPIFREQVDVCAELLKPHLGIDLREMLYPDERHINEAEQQLQQTALAQPALFVVEYALAKLWMSWGIQPQAMIGHSIGEYVAACLAGVFSLEDALTVVARRGQLAQSLPPGVMLTISCSEQEIQPLLGHDLSLAAVNGPALCVVAGPPDAVAALQDQLVAHHLEYHRLHTSHAFHSSMMDPVLTPLTEQIKKIHLKRPTIPYLSNLTGAWITEEEATDPDYWARHLRHPVRFSSGVRALLQVPDRVFLEVGPGRTLCTLVRHHLDHTAAGRVVLPSLHHPQESSGDTAFLLNTLGRLWLAGVSVDWPEYYAREQRCRLPLPTYPFERQRYWVDPPRQIHQAPTGQVAIPQAAEREPSGAAALDTSTHEEPAFTLYQRPHLATAYVAPSNEIEQSIAAIWQELLGIEQVGIYDDFFELGGHSLMATQLISRLREAFPVELPLKALFEAPTIARFAEVIEELLIQQLEALPEEDAERLI